MLVKKIVKNFSNGALGHGKSRTLRVGAVAHQRQDAFPSDLSEALQVNGVSEYRRIIHFKVACVDYDSRRGIDRQRRRVLDTVVRLNKFNGKISQVDHLSVLHLFQFGGADKIMFLQLVGDQRKSQLRGIDRHVHFFQYIRQRADMVLMAVGDHKPLHLGNILLQIGNVRDHKIDTQHVVLRERQPAVYYYYTVSVLECCNIHSDLFQTAQRNDLQLLTTLPSSAPAGLKLVPYRCFCRIQRPAVLHGLFFCIFGAVFLFRPVSG